MAVLKLNNVPVITEAAGVAQMANTLKFPAGHVLQVVGNSPDKAQLPTTSTTYVTSGLTQAITPSATSSKVFITIHASVNTQNNADTYLTIFRGSTNLSPGGANDSHAFCRQYTSGGSAGDVWMNQTLQFLDSPNTTSATTYALYFRSGSGNQVALYCGGFTAPTITLMEVTQ